MKPGHLRNDLDKRVQVQQSAPGAEETRLRAERLGFARAILKAITYVVEDGGHEVSWDMVADELGPSGEVFGDIRSPGPARAAMLSTAELTIQAAENRERSIYDNLAESTVTPPGSPQAHAEPPKTI